MKTRNIVVIPPLQKNKKVVKNKNCALYLQTTSYIPSKHFPPERLDTIAQRLHIVT